MLFVRGDHCSSLSSDSFLKWRPAAWETGEIQWCHKITRLYVYASIGSLVLAFCSGERHSGARLLTWPLDNWISEDMMWCVRIHTHSGVCVMGSDTWHACRMRAEMWWGVRHRHTKCPVWNLCIVLYLSVFWKSKNRNRKLFVVPVTFLELSMVLNVSISQRNMAAHNTVSLIHPQW